MEHLGASFFFTAKQLILLIGGEGAGGASLRLGGGRERRFCKRHGVHPRPPVAAPERLSPPLPEPRSPSRSRSPSPGGGLPEGDEQREPRSGGRLVTVIADREPGGEGGEAEAGAARGSRGEAGSEWPAQPRAGPGRPGRSRRGSARGCYLTPDREIGSPRNTKETRATALAPSRSPRPAPGAPLAESGSRRSANFLSQKTQLAQSESGGPGPAPTLSLRPIPLSSFQK